MSEKEDFYQVVQSVVTESLANTHTILVARVENVRGSTIDCKPTINRVVDGEGMELAVFPEVPVVYLQGGGSYTAHPIAKGDYCLLLVSERCFDSWYAGSDFVKPLDARMFDYSDAFALVGVNPMRAAIKIPDVITHIGDTYQQGDYEHQGNRTQAGDYILFGDQVVNGNLTVTGDLGVGGGLNVGGDGHIGGNLTVGGSVTDNVGG